jgi:IS5 family transposase
MEEALYETTILRQFAGLSLERVPDETTILNFRRLLEKHELAAGILGVINCYLGDRGLSDDRLHGVSETWVWLTEARSLARRLKVRFCLHPLSNNRVN